ncbi:MAG TPA: hypothetical protein VFO94_19965, partial [Gammaproteobacteria bacterium]|nr:hypothetical protein [Gammaproteobacteria bacterium]
MADNTDLSAAVGTGDKVVTREISHGGDTAKLQGVFAMGISGTEGAYTAAAIGGDATNGLDVDVTRSALPTGAATSAKQDTAQTALDAIQAAVEGTLTVDASGAAVPVTDNGGTLSIDDGGGAITVDGTVAVTNAGLTELAAAINASSQLDVNIAAQAGALTVASHAVTNAGTFAVQAAQSGTWTVQIGNTANTTPILASIHDGTTKASVADLTNSNPLHVAIVDTNGDQIASFGGGTQYTEDAAAAANPVGTVPILVRADTPAGITSANGDNVAQRGTDYGAAFVQVLDSSGNFIDTFGGSGGTAVADGATFTRDTTQITPAGAAVESSAPTLTNGDVAALSMTTGGALRVAIDAALPAGTNAIGKLAANSGVDIGDVDVTSVTPGTAAGNLGKAEDAAHASGDTGVMALAVRTDTATQRAGTDGDYSPLTTDANGRLHVITGPSTGTIEVVGDVADDAAASGNPVLVAGVAVETDGTDPTTVSAEGDLAYLRTDRARRLLVSQHHPRGFFVSADYSAAQTNASVKAAPGAGLKLYITDIIISNGATAGNVTLLDGSGGTVLFELYPAINGGVSISLKQPIVLTANTALCIT